MKFRLVEDFGDLLLEDRKPAIEPGSELEKSLIYDIEHTDKSYRQLSKEYGIATTTVRDFVHRKNLRTDYLKHYHDKKERNTHVYFNTLEAYIQSVNGHITTRMNFLPSIYLGEYPVSIITGMYEHIKNTYFSDTITQISLIEFYLKIVSNEISLNTLIAELKAQSTGSSHGYPSTFNYKFITVSTTKVSTVDFYSTNYSQLAKDLLTLISRKRYSSSRSYNSLKAVASKIDIETANTMEQTNTYISTNLEKIAHNIYSKNGDIIEPTNYIKGIPYETSFSVSSPQDISSCMKKYKGYILYGFINKTGDVVYIGMSVNAESRAKIYENEDRSLILKAFEEGIIKQLVIFKSNFPIQSWYVNTHLIYALEVYFAEVLFKTYPANYPKALNTAKPGQHSSSILATQNRMDLETYINKQDKLLSSEEYKSVVKEITGGTGSRYPYYMYAQKYISDYKTDLSFEDKKTLYNSLHGDKKELLWDYCSSESEYRELIPKSYMPSVRQELVNDWKNYRIKNNLPITEDLDDDIDMEYYV